MELVTSGDLEPSITCRLLSVIALLNFYTSRPLLHLGYNDAIKTSTARRYSILSY
jgi:hypothetical protein